MQSVDREEKLAKMRTTVCENNNVTARELATRDI